MSDLSLEQIHLIYSGDMSVEPDVLIKLVPWIPNNLLAQATKLALGLSPDSEFKSRIIAMLAARLKPGKETLIERRMAAARIDILTEHHLKGRGDPQFLEVIASTVPIRFLPQVLELGVRTDGGNGAIKALLSRLPSKEREQIKREFAAHGLDRIETEFQSLPQNPSKDMAAELLKIRSKIETNSQTILFNQLAYFLTQADGREIGQNLIEVRSIKFQDLRRYLSELGKILAVLPDSIWQDEGLTDRMLLRQLEEQYSDHPVVPDNLNLEKESYLNSLWLQRELACVLEISAYWAFKYGNPDPNVLAGWLHDLSAFLSAPLLVRALEIGRKIEQRNCRAHACSAILASIGRLRQLPAGYTREQLLQEALVESLQDTVFGSIQEGGPGPLFPPMAPPPPPQKIRDIYDTLKMAKPPQSLFQITDELMAAKLPPDLLITGEDQKKETALLPAYRRLVNTVFSPKTQPQKALEVNMPLTGGLSYYFCLWVGVQDPNSMQRGTTLPVEHLPKEASLRIALYGYENEIEITPGADVGELKLLPNGTAEVTRQPLQQEDPRLAAALGGQRLFFPVAAPARSGKYKLRCNIYYKQILVQSHLIYAMVTRHPKPTPGALHSVVDYTLSQTLSPAHLNNMEPHRLSLMLNSNGGETHAFFFGGQDKDKGSFKSEVTIPESMLKQPIVNAREALRKVSWNDKSVWSKSSQQKYKYADQKLNIERLSEDLTSMAICGTNLYNALIDNLMDDKFSERRKKAYALRELMLTPGLVQIALRQSPTHVLPAALFYDYPLDTQQTNHKICEAFIKSLKTEVPLSDTACFQGRCPSYNMEDHVCPSGFWGFRHILGVPISLGDNEGNTNKGDPDTATQILIKDKIEMVVGAANDLDRLESHMEHLQKPNKYGLGWHYSLESKDVLELLLEIKSHIIYFYCHGILGNDQATYLKMSGVKDFLSGADLRRKSILWDDPHPLVFINGCQTTALDPERAMSLVQDFMGTGGAGVIGTEITVFEPLATVFAEECLRLFLSGDKTIGEAIKSARLKLLKEEGNPLGLVYTPFAIPSLRIKKE